MKDFGAIDISVNNAGIAKDGLMLTMSESQWDSVISVNLKGAFNFIHTVTPIIMQQRTGSIINFASISGVYGSPGQANYAAAKAGQIALLDSITQEIGRGIRANVIAPRHIETSMTELLSENVRKGWLNLIALHRPDQVDKIANVAFFLASDLSSYISGQVIQVDGGLHAMAGVWRGAVCHSMSKI